MNLNELFSKVFEASKDEIDVASIDLPYSLEVDRSISSRINLSTIASHLIKTAGLCCERYASDFLITWDEVKEAIETYASDITKGEPTYIAFGFRKNGVDSNSYIVSRLQDDISVGLKEYIHILVVEITAFNLPNLRSLYVTLKNVDNNICSVMKQHLNECDTNYFDN